MQEANANFSDIQQQQLSAQANIDSLSSQLVAAQASGDAEKIRQLSEEKLEATKKN
ncbi:MAG: hypothetical protein H6925_05600 [Holosporaceae bacterium]|nr:MAG: hypothetical protein H6925_05600 [Holosporaceae bacterium]